MLDQDGSCLDLEGFIQSIATGAINEVPTNTNGSCSTQYRLAWDTRTLNSIRGRSKWTKTPDAEPNSASFGLHALGSSAEMVP
mmetsp:Transcript_69174/g.193375  ORF Transcript_69174/g.193375 Transcript_69174/m.193375 type:complete len:83 (-) Transcript_69174:214-462(-)